MDLYDFHDDPKSLDHHDSAHEQVPILFWKKLLVKSRDLSLPQKKTLFEPYEKSLLKSPRFAYLYTKDVLKGRWPEGEDTIAQDAKYSYMYARHILRGKRFLKGEEIISKDPAWAESYAQEIIKGRWPKGEAAISKDAFCAHAYAMYVIRDRFPDGEKAIKSDKTLWMEYVEKFPESEDDQS